MYAVSAQNLAQAGGAVSGTTTSLRGSPPTARSTSASAPRPARGPPSTECTALRERESWALRSGWRASLRIPGLDRLTHLAPRSSCRRKLQVAAWRSCSAHCSASHGLHPGSQAGHGPCWCRGAARGPGPSTRTSTAGPDHGSGASGIRPWATARAPCGDAGGEFGNSRLVQDGALLVTRTARAGSTYNRSRPRPAVPECACCAPVAERRALLPTGTATSRASSAPTYS